MPLVFNPQSSQPFTNKYASKFSRPLWTTCPSALLSFFFLSFLFFFFPHSIPCSLSSYRAVPLVFNRQSSQPFPNKYAINFSHPVWTTCPSALLSFFCFFLFFSFFFPPSFPCSLSSYRAMPLVFNRQSSQPFTNKYVSKFSRPLWTTCPSALLSFICFFLFFLFFPLLLFLARFLLTVPCLWYLTVNHRNRFQISTQVSFPIRSGQLVPQLFSLLFFFSFFCFFFPSFFSLLAFFLPCHTFGI